MKSFAAIALVSWAVFVAAGPAHAQLAITEVMSAPGTDAISGFRGPEYWELTNFGTNAVSLDGYGFRDSDSTRPLVKDPFTNLVIRPQESIVFFRVADAKDSVTNTAQFRAWWGEDYLPVDLQCRMWKSPGLSGWDGDSVALYDSARRLVDFVSFGRARLGRAFSYGPDSGWFGIFSAAGVDGAFSSVRGDAAGSPGSTTGPVPLQIQQAPTAQAADAGMGITFTAVVSGLPRPQLQWFGSSQTFPLATGPALVLSNVQSGSAGSYFVVATNGLQSITSGVVRLTVNTNPTPPQVTVPPGDLVVFDRQTARFTVQARGLPPPAYQWQSNHVDLFGATGPILELADVRPAHGDTEYSVRVWNALGTTNVSARLTVVRRPDLRFTEVMSLPSDEEGNRHFDWFELTNFDTNAVDLAGWRFSDQQSFVRAYTISNAFVLQPGESAVFAERLNLQQFGDWWGVDQLPAGLKFCAYSGFGLGYFGEQLFLWNAAAVDPNDPVATVSWAAATLGVSFECEHWCDPEGNECLDEGTTESRVGVGGAFRATGGIDVGSPGYVVNPSLRLLFLEMLPGPSVTVHCRVVPGRRYRLLRTASLAGSSWEPVANAVAAGNVLTLQDPDPAPSVGSLFYRAEEVP